MEPITVEKVSGDGKSKEEWLWAAKAVINKLATSLPFPDEYIG